MKVPVPSRFPRIVCMTSDKYIEAVRPYIWLLKKYWGFDDGPVDVLVAGFTEPEFDLNNLGGNGNVRVEFHSIGAFEDYPLARWSDALIKLLDDIDDEYIILMLEDYWVMRRINAPAIRLAYEYMVRYPKTLKFDLAADRLYAKDSVRNYRYQGWLDVVKSDINSPYHMSLMTGMWHTGWLKEVLVPGWDPWNIEIDGTTHLKNYPYLEVVGSEQWPVRHTLAFRSGDSSKILLEDISQTDVYALKGLGFLKRWNI